MANNHQQQHHFHQNADLSPNNLILASIGSATNPVRPFQPLRNDWRGAGGAIGGLIGAGGLATGGQNVFFLNKYRQKKLYHHEIDHQHQSGLLGAGKFIGGGALAGALGGGGALAGGLPTGVGGGALASALNGAGGALASGLPTGAGGGALNRDYGDGYHRTLGNVAAYDDAVGSGRGSGALGDYGGTSYARYPRAGYESFNGYAPTIGNGNTRMTSGPYQTDYRRYTDS